MTIFSPCRFFVAKSVTRMRLAFMTAPSALERVFDGAGGGVAEAAPARDGDECPRRRAIQVGHVRRTGSERRRMRADRAYVAALHGACQRGLRPDLARITRAGDAQRPD